MMTSRERLKTVLSGKIPDCVPVAPDFSNMIPAKRTGKPFWDLYLYNDPPIWEAYIDCAKFFNIDSLMDGYAPLVFPDQSEQQNEWQEYIVFKNDERIVTQKARKRQSGLEWKKFVNVYYRSDPPTWNVKPDQIGLSEVPAHWEPVVGVKPVDISPTGFARLKKMLGDQGLIGASVTSTCAFNTSEQIIDYYENPDKHEEWAQQRVEDAQKRFNQIMALPLEQRPDFLCVGGSGTLIFQTPDMVRQLTLPAVKRVIELATAAGMPTHVHSCGPESALVKIMAEETDLTIIDPLEIPPMGDCILADLKKLYGKKLTLKGNLHTTDVMLQGSVEDVVRASKKAIDDAAEGGRFVLSTGDQCGRDTPFENLHAMIETARTYGRY